MQKGRSIKFSRIYCRKKYLCLLASRIKNSVLNLLLTVYKSVKTDRLGTKVWLSNKYREHLSSKAITEMVKEDLNRRRKAHTEPIQASTVALIAGSMQKCGTKLKPFQIRLSAGTDPTAVPTRKKKEKKHICLARLAKVFFFPQRCVH